MTGDASDFVVNPARAAQDPIRLPRLDQQAQKWRRALESEIVKHEAGSATPDPGRNGEASAGGYSQEREWNDDPVAVEALTNPGGAPVEAANPRGAPVEVESPIDSLPTNAIRRPLADPVVQRAEMDLGKSFLTLPADRQIAPRRIAVAEALPVREFIPDSSPELNKPHWAIAKQGAGVVLAYTGPALGNSEFRAMADLCCRLLNEQGIRVVRLVNKGTVVFDQPTTIGEMAAGADDSADYIVNRKF